MVSQRQEHWRGKAAPVRKDSRTTSCHKDKVKQRRIDTVGKLAFERHLTQLVRAPQSKEDLLRLEAADQLETLHLSTSWFKLIPLHIGGNESVDLAARLFMRSNDFALRNPRQSHPHRPSLALYENYWRLYGRTIDNLRRLLSTTEGALSDEALLSCALLAHSERGMGFQSRSKDLPLKNTLSHLHGIQAILTARQATNEPSELTFSILAGQQTLLYEVPVALGTASPFENMSWFQPPPSGSPLASVQIARLRVIGQRLLIDLPRLEMYMSRANKVCQKRISASSFWATKRLAKCLLRFKDEDAENTLLHKVNVSRTKKTEDAVCIPYSYTFQSITDFEAGIYYWQSRLMLLRLCWRIARFDHSLDQDEIVAEGVRATKNLLMSWQYGEEQHMFGLIRYVFACKAIWGAVMDFQDAFDDRTELRKSLARRISQLMTGIYGQITEDKLDHIARGLDGDGRDGPSKSFHEMETVVQESTCTLTCRRENRPCSTMCPFNRCRLLISVLSLASVSTELAGNQANCTWESKYVRAKFEPARTGHHRPLALPKQAALRYPAKVVNMATVLRKSDGQRLRLCCGNFEVFVDVNKRAESSLYLSCRA